jgi:hypothetical protein
MKTGWKPPGHDSRRFVINRSVIVQALRIHLSASLLKPLADASHNLIKVYLRVANFNHPVRLGHPISS